MSNIPNALSIAPTSLLLLDASAPVRAAAIVAAAAVLAALCWIAALGRQRQTPSAATRHAFVLPGHRRNRRVAGTSPA